MSKTPQDFDNAVRELMDVLRTHLERIVGPFVRWLSDVLNRRKP